MGSEPPVPSYGSRVLPWCGQSKVVQNICGMMPGATEVSSTEICVCNTDAPDREVFNCDCQARKRTHLNHIGGVPGL